MQRAHYILATAGHVDHGKSALVKALTGTDPDRLPEEKARGITIDLGFAHMVLDAPATESAGAAGAPDPPPPSATAPAATAAPAATGPAAAASAAAASRSFSVGIVDVPGHEDFVRNMVSGMGAVDAALLAVAADDGWMPQSEEHLQILQYLRVPRAVVALTKIDLLAEPHTRAIDAVRARLAGSRYAFAPIVPVSTVDGRGLASLRQALATILQATPPPEDHGKPRLPIDRVFTLRGIGTVVTGTLIGGELRRGQDVVIQPGGQRARIRSLQSHNRELGAAVPGMRVALSLPEVRGATPGGADPGAARRGAVVTVESLGPSSRTLDVRLERSARGLGAASSGRRPLRDGARVWIHLASAHAPARVVLLDGRALEPGETGLAQLRLESAMMALAGDRLVVRDWAEQTTLAGGLVLDPDATRDRVRAPARRGFLEALSDATADPKATLEARLRHDGVLHADGALVRSQFAQSAVVAAAANLVAAGIARAVDSRRWVESGAWARWRSRTLEAIDADHRAHPQRLGLGLNELRALAETFLPAADLFDSLLADLCRDHCAVSGAVIRRREHQAALPTELQPLGARIRAALAAHPLEPPPRADLAPDPASRQALRYLLETGQLVELSPELVLSVEVYARLSNVVRRHIRTSGPATVSDLRRTVGGTRRLVVPLLERMDRDAITVRDGDRRRLR
jgi:selenocysteine-specific elongation factor